MGRRDEVRVGVFVLLAIVAATAISLWILGTGVLGGTPNRYQIRLFESGGVRQGDRVRVAGVAAGRIESLSLEPGDERPVLLEVSLDESLQLYEGASAHLSSDGLLGASYVEIDPGGTDGEPLEPGATLLGRESGSLDSVYARLEEVAVTAGETLEQITSLAASLEQGLEPALAQMSALVSEENVRALSAVLAETERTMTDLRPRLVSLLDRTDLLVQDLRRGVGELPALAEEVSALTADLRAALGEDGAALAAVLETARDTLESYDAEEGAMAEVLDDLQETLARLKSLSQTLEDRPSSLLGLRPAPDRRPGGDRP